MKRIYPQVHELPVKGKKSLEPFIRSVFITVHMLQSRVGMFHFACLDMDIQEISISTSQYQYQYTDMDTSFILYFPFESKSRY
jgi:hypothetical protein